MDQIKINMNKKNNYLSKFACKDDASIRIKEEQSDFRTSFFRDVDRVIYTLSYNRYLDKTQVFTYYNNDHVSKRMTHVQYVSKIARTIGRALSLNEDLIEAAALGHDLGHVPYGHVGEVFLNDLSLKHNEGYFKHNHQSVRVLMNVENYGKGSNLSYQVLDAILCHNGEILNEVYVPKKKNIDDFLKEYKEVTKEKVYSLVPSTLEGCVVRISDLIGYIGRDIEDGIMLGIIKLDDIPKNIIDILGKTNREIVNTIVTDLINNSIDKNYIKLSENIYKAMLDLKKFNYKNIYIKAYTDKERENIKLMFDTLFNKYLNDLEKNNIDSPIIKSYLNNMCDEYKANTNARIVIDYIAGMTDMYFLNAYDSLNL